MGRSPRPRPAHLPEKLLAIRQRLGLSQTEMCRALTESRLLGDLQLRAWDTRTAARRAAQVRAAGGTLYRFVD